MRFWRYRIFSIANEFDFTLYPADDAPRPALQIAGMEIPNWMENYIPAVLPAITLHVSYFIALISKIVLQNERIQCVAPKQGDHLWPRFSS